MDNSGSQEVIKAIAAVQQDIKHMSKQIDTITAISDKTIRIEESTRVAHKRINEVIIEVDDMKKLQRQVWMAFLAGFISLAGTLITLVLTNTL